MTSLERSFGVSAPIASVGTIATNTTSANTKLDTLHTMVADTYVKLGFRYRAHPKKVEWYVNGVRPGGTIAPAMITAAELAAAAAEGGDA